MNKILTCFSSLMQWCWELYSIITRTVLPPHVGWENPFKMHIKTIHLIIVVVSQDVGDISVVCTHACMHACMYVYTHVCV